MILKFIDKASCSDYHRYNKKRGVFMMNLTKPDEKIAILTCMDMRLDPKKFPGLEQSKAYVIRNAGGRANEETIRSLVVAHKFQGAKAIFVIQHTDCGMMNFTNDILCDLLEESLQTAVYGNNGWYNPIKEGGSRAGQYINFQPIRNLEQSVTDDVTYIRNHPLISKKIPIYGYICDVKTGELQPVQQAMQVGQIQE